MREGARAAGGYGEEEVQRGGAEEAAMGLGSREEGDVRPDKRRGGKKKRERKKRRREKERKGKKKEKK